MASQLAFVKAQASYNHIEMKNIHVHHISRAALDQRRAR